jgi:PAS domain S-box-containing protein
MLDSSTLFNDGLTHALFTRLHKNGVLLLDKTGTVLKMNTSFTNFFGYTPEDLIGENVSVLYTMQDKLKDLPHREINTVLAQGQSNDENYLVDKDQNLIWVAGESVRVESEQSDPFILKIIYNLQQLKESEAAIVRLNSLNQNILESITDIVIVINEQGELEKANYSFFRLCENCTTDEILQVTNKLIEDIEVKQGNKLFDLLRGFSSDQKMLTHKISILIKEQELIFDIQCSLLAVDEDTNHLLLTLHDITADTQITREREDIIGFVAHELRNPLANIMLCNEMIDKLIAQNKAHDVTPLVIRSNNNAKRLNNMISELNDATKVSAGKFALEITTFDVSEMVEEGVNTIAALHPAYTINIDNQVGPLSISGDRYRLIQVVTNFLTNGIKYSNGGTNIEISIRKDAENVIVSVQDEGLGIAPTQLPRLFQRFFRAEKTKNLEGIGLGLYLCRQIILAHSGNIWAESTEGHGSTFYFSVPVNPHK